MLMILFIQPYLFQLEQNVVIRLMPTSGEPNSTLHTQRCAVINYPQSRFIMHSTTVHIPYNVASNVWSNGLRVTVSSGSAKRR
jgi:hypothetical protein